jgi:predicted ATP-dependent endonuclease of OLD family
LKFFSEINLIFVEKAGVYVPSQPVIDYFRKIGDSKSQAKQGIKRILEDYEVFSETLFLAESGEFDLEGLSLKVAGQLDVDKDEVESISTAIEIFTQLGYIEISDDGSVSRVINSQNETKQESKSSEKSDKQSSKESLDTKIDSDIETPPSKSDPDTLLQVVDALSRGGVYSTEELTKDTELSKRKVQATTNYGRELGFIEKQESGHQLTDSGFELSFSSEGSEREELYKNAITQCHSYKHIIRASCDELDFEGDVLDSQIIKKELRTTFGLRDISDTTVREVINTLLKSLDAAGFGEYIVGRGGKNTRIESSSEELESLCDQVASAHSVHQESDKVDNSASSEQSSVSEEELVDAEDADDTKESGSIDEGTVESDTRGPAVRISEIRIQNFRNIRDTGFIGLENVTTLIGENESGKTSTLEAINSFSEEYEYKDRDLPTSTDIDENEKMPIISLLFEINESIIDEFYPQLPEEFEPPLTIIRTKYFDNSYTAEVDAQIDADEVELPTPNILYYDSYDLIDDKATISQLENGERNTFKNILSLGGLSIKNLKDSPLSLFNMIEDAENKIEEKINNAWSQKSLKINLEWNDSNETIHLLIQDQLNPDSPTDERPLTYPSQRSEGFQWFLSFYINLLSESTSSGLESKVLLLDDPAVYLHPEGKRDWLESVNEIGNKDQVVFSSHSPYLIDKRYPSRIRAVEDTPRQGTKIREDIFGSSRRTLEPLRNALGVNLGSSPFVSGKQLLVEGPTEYYVIAAVANYFSQELNRNLFGWQEISVMPVRGAPNVVGKGSWLESEDINFAIMLDSDQEGRDIYQRIDNHNPDINSDRVTLLQNSVRSEDVVTEDLFDPQLYVSAFNEVYEDFTSELDGVFEPATIEENEGLRWDVSGIEYDGSRLDKVLIEYLENTQVAEDLKNSRGEIELRKRQIAEKIASRINKGKVNEEQLSAFNRLFSQIDSAMMVNN